MTSNPHHIDEYPEERFIRRFDDPDETPVTAIVEAVEEYSGVDATELPPMPEFIDPDSLNQLLETPPGSTADVITVSFPYSGYHVRVSSDRVLTLEPVRAGG